MHHVENQDSFTWTVELPLIPFSVLLLYGETEIQAPVTNTVACGFFRSVYAGEMQNY